MKKILFIALMAATFSANAAVSVSSQTALVSALSGSDKDITITASFTTSQNIEIPAGYTVTVADGVTVTLGSSGWLFKRYFSLTGSGTLVTAARTIKTTSVRTLPTVGGGNNRFAGMTYDVTTVVVSGGTVKKSNDSENKITCPCKTSVSVDGGTTWQYLETDPVAVVCSVSSGINGGRAFVGAYSTFEAAYNAAKNTENIVVLLADGSFTVEDKRTYVSATIDCAGKSGKINRGGIMTGYSGEFASSSFITFLNGSSVGLPKLTNSGAAFINCSSASITEINAGEGYTTQSHVYDCGTVSLCDTYPSNGGAFFYCGGPYSVSFGTNYKVYGGTFKNDPTAYLATTDLEAVQDSDGNWSIQEKAPVVNVAAIGDTGYETLQAAVDAAAAGAKITLLSDIALTAPVTVAAGKDLTVELAGMDIASSGGAFVNNGTLKLEDSSTFDEPSTLSTESGDLIVNNGTLEITYGTYAGDILLNAGTFTVHHGTFDGALKAGEGVSDPKALSNIRGGRFKTSVAAFLADGYLETLDEDYLWVGKFPYATVSDAAISGAEKGWSITGLSDEDRAIYARTSTLRSDYSDADWYRRAELISMLTPYAGYVIDCVVTFNRSVAAESIRVYARTSASTSQKLDSDVAANEGYRALSTQVAAAGYTQVSFSRFLTEDGFSTISVGFGNLSDANAGTVCTIEFQLCTAKNNAITGTKYVLASGSYQFPWAEGDAIPELREDDSAETVASALEGTADVRVTQNITDVASYNSYRTWAAGVTASGTATAADVKASENAWLSYALNTTNLVETPSSADVTVSSIAPAADGAFALEISVKDVDIGVGRVSEAQMQANLAQVFGIEGAASLDAGAFSSTNVVYSLGQPVDGKVPVSVKPARTGNAFFMRARLTP